MIIGPDVRPKHARSRPFVIVWAILLLLASVKVLTAFLGMGVWAPIAQFGIVAVQAAIVFTFFMRLKGSPSLKWVFVVTGFLWLSFLYGLSMTDYADRQGWPLAHGVNTTSLRAQQDNADLPR